jgi:transcriptional regulator with XRE-family HTH domain
MNRIDTKEIIRVDNSDWYHGISKEMNPGKYLKTLREACGLTLAELANKLDSSPARICDYEAGRRQVSKAVAKKLSSIFLVGADKFI